MEDYELDALVLAFVQKENYERNKQDSQDAKSDDEE